jgi:hypothetical protein
MAQWTLTDNSTGSPVVLEFPLNPNAFDPPGYQPQIQEEQATAPGSPVVVFLGRMKAARGQFTGIIHNASWLAIADTWFTKWYPMTLTDDEGRSWDILITDYTKKRLKRAINRDRHDYTVDFMEIG